jgi:hypothetical protein
MDRPGFFPALGLTVLALAPGFIALALAHGAAFAQSPRTDSPLPPLTNDANRDDFFADPALRVFQIELSEAAMESLRRSSNSYVRGTVREGAQVFTNVGIHLKGLGSFQPLERKPSFVVRFNEFTPGLAYRGLTKLMLNNSVQDQTYLAEWLAAGLFREAGLPAVRVTHARVMLNGRALGLYVAAEAMNKRFLERCFRNGTGNLYEGYVRDIDAPLEQDNGRDQSQADRRALLAACRAPDLSERWRRLQERLDVERFVSFAAMEMLVAHWDGYTGHTNNYRLYHDPVLDKMVFIPHGLDATFRTPNLSILPPTNSVVGRAVFETVEGRQLYEQRLRALYASIFKPTAITNLLEEALARLRAARGAEPELAGIRRRMNIMNLRIAQRAARLGELLAGREPAPLRFDDSGRGRPEGWHEELVLGEPELDQRAEGDRAALRIAARDGRCRASWRTMVYLQPGRYRFEGRVRTEGLNRGTVGLRISGEPEYRRLADAIEWQEVAHEFEVKEPGRDVDLVCEFDAYAGTAWFDLNSLFVRKRRAP